MIHLLFIKNAHKDSKKMIDYRFVIFFIVFGCIVPAKAADLPSKASEHVPSVVAEMGHVKISAVEFDAFKRQLDPEIRVQLEKDVPLQKKLAQDAIIKKFLIDQARSVGFDKKSDVREQMDRTAEQSLLAQYIADQVKLAPDFPSEAEIKNLYEKNKEVLRQPDKVRVAQIFLDAPMDADETIKKKARAQIYQLFKEVVAAPKKFGDVAKQKSDHQESAAKGGDMGLVSLNQLIPELLPVVSSLQPNEISSPVQSGGGWHILKLLEVQKGEIVPLSAVKMSLTNALRRQTMQKKEQEFLQYVVTKTPPTINIK
ncbi:MAG: peptidyl-prolyl cis-trans isomerase [Magnetococcus sp. YQC-5]